jgi:hypothetical protein
MIFSWGGPDFKLQTDDTDNENQNFYHFISELLCYFFFRLLQMNLVFNKCFSFILEWARNILCYALAYDDYNITF